MVPIEKNLFSKNLFLWSVELACRNYLHLKQQAGISSLNIQKEALKIYEGNSRRDVQGSHNSFAEDFGGGIIEQQCMPLQTQYEFS